MEIVSKFTPPYPLSTPVLFLIFNRLDTTKQVFEMIRKAKPPRLYIGADGPRENIPGEEERVKAVREHVLNNIDWDCDVKTLFRDKNLGCGKAVSEAITWFFENEEMGIILEDDCLPSQSFFWFCEELLKKYKDDERIFMISGYNKQNVWRANNYDYFFSHFGGIWGWASWKRAWKYYDFEMSDIDIFIAENNFEKLLGKKLGIKRQREIYNIINAIKVKKIYTWDYQWGYARHKNSGLSCVPVYSLVENIGFGPDATHTLFYYGKKVNRHEINFPIRHPKFFIPDTDYDKKFLEQGSKIYRLISNIYKRLW